jgi:hypothetical protein
MRRSIQPMELSLRWDKPTGGGRVPSRSEKDKRYHRSLHAAVAWCVDDFDRAGRLLDELGDEVDDRALEAMGTSLAGMRWDIGRGAAGDR